MRFDFTTALTWQCYLEPSDQWRVRYDETPEPHVNRLCLQIGDKWMAEVVGKGRIEQLESASNKSEFRGELEHLINRHSLENGSNTPDFILAEYLMSCLDAFEQNVKKRDDWYREDEW